MEIGSAERAEWIRTHCYICGVPFTDQEIAAIEAESEVESDYGPNDHHKPECDVRLEQA